MSACSNFEPFLLERASGTLAPEEAAALEKHLKGCAACSAEANALSEALSLAKLPPPSTRERIALNGLPLSTLAAWHRAERRGKLFRRASIGFAAAAALAALSVMPSLVSKGRPARVVPEREDPTLAALETWSVEDSLADAMLADGSDLNDLTLALSAGGSDEGE